MVLGMMSVGAPDHVLSSAKDTGNIVDRYSELEQHRRAGVPKDVRGDFRAEPR
jgi:hypothetical protein